MTSETIAAARFLASTAVKKATISAIQARPVPAIALTASAAACVTARTATGYRASDQRQPAHDEQDISSGPGRSMVRMP